MEWDDIKRGTTYTSGGKLSWLVVDVTPIAVMWRYTHEKDMEPITLLRSMAYLEGWKVIKHKYKNIPREET